MEVLLIIFCYAILCVILSIACIGNEPMKLNEIDTELQNGSITDVLRLRNQVATVEREIERRITAYCMRNAGELSDSGWTLMFVDMEKMQPVLYADICFYEDDEYSGEDGLQVEVRVHGAEYNQVRSNELKMARLEELVAVPETPAKD